MRNTGQLFRVFCRLFQVKGNVSALAYNLSLICLFSYNFAVNLIFIYTRYSVSLLIAKDNEEQNENFSKADISPSCLALLIAHMNYSPSIFNSIRYTS